MPENGYYVIVLDKVLGWCKLYTVDSEHLPPGEILWSGHNLQIGYEQMRRLNNERREIPVYHVAEMDSTSKKAVKGRKIFGVFKTRPSAPWAILCTLPEYAAAKKRVTELRLAQTEREQGIKIRQLEFLKQLHINKTRIPNLTETDKKYLEWLSNSETKSAVVKAEAAWFKENVAK